MRYRDPSNSRTSNTKTRDSSFPQHTSKFAIWRDPVKGAYLTLSNNNTDPARPSQRNVLSLHASEDLLRWRHVITLLGDDSGLAPEQSIARIGCQYVDWQFDGDNIIYVVRAAYQGAHNFHNANHIAFAKIENFRQLLTRSCDRR